MNKSKSTYEYAEDKSRISRSRLIKTLGKSKGKSKWTNRGAGEVEEESESTADWAERESPLPTFLSRGLTVS